MTKKRKIIAAINMTLDGYCDHTSIPADQELHQHYAALLDNAGVILYGRITYQLMQFWQTLLTHPSGDTSMDAFAIAIDRIPKIVFSNSLKNTEWDSAEMCHQSLEQTVETLQQQSGKDIFIGSRSLIMQLLPLHRLDELQICIHPVAVGKGLPLFDALPDRTVFSLIQSKTLGSGAMVLYYEPLRQDTTIH